jgi:putative peptide zinc metalloprotease protein
MPLLAYQIISYVVSFAVYTAIFNWKLAAILTIGISFHECGHLLAAHHCKMKTKGWFLIPFFGGISLIQGSYRKYSDQAFIALAGPGAGLLLTAICYLFFWITGFPMLGNAALWLGIMNVFNLIPLAMIDGGQLLESITYSINETVGCCFVVATTLIAIPILWVLNPRQALVMP